MTNDPKRLVSPRTLVLGVCAAVAAARPASAQLMSAIDLSSRTARPAAAGWQNQLAVSPFARFDHSRFTLDGRWTAYAAEGERVQGFGAASATYFSPARAGLQLSLSGFATRDLLNETFAVSRFGTDARVSYKTARSGVWIGREIFRDNKSTPISPVPRASGGVWQQWGGAVVTVSMSALGGHERHVSSTTQKVPSSDTLSRDSVTITTTDTTDRRRGASDAEVALHWGTGRLAFRGVVGTRFLTARQPNEMWGQVQGTYAVANDIALIASGGVHPSSAAYGVSRARYMQVGFRIAPSALLKPRLPAGVRPVAAAFEVKNADQGQRTLRIRVPSARMVELSADFTGWKPVTLTRAENDRWEATLPISPGMHRIAIRVDGDSWTPPPGVSTVPDEFQGTVGVIIVR
jgi:hypothetical protein